jgi:DNA-binding transcriptional LysR family regulator
MEMHQVRYFLAVAKTLNFTRAADECNVTQPSLTRAIKQLEGELGGDLFRRERPPQLTELGQRLLPLLRQCYESAVGARSLASSLRTGEVGALRLALSRTIDLSVVVPFLQELRRAFRNIEMKLMRGTTSEVTAWLKNGEAELGLAADLPEDWERLDRWPLFTESFLLLVNGEHPLAARNSIALDDLRSEQMLLRGHCEYATQFADLLRGQDIDLSHSHEVTSEHDLILLVEAGMGIGVLPQSTTTPISVTRKRIDQFELRRTVHLYGVAGRQRTAVASTIMKMLRAADWSGHLN